MSSAMSDEAARIPSDPDARARLYRFAGLTDEERHAMDVWCFTEQQKRARGVLLYEGEPRGGEDA